LSQKIPGHSSGHKTGKTLPCQDTVWFPSWGHHCNAMSHQEAEPHVPHVLPFETSTQQNWELKKSIRLKKDHLCVTRDCRKHLLCYSH